MLDARDTALTKAAEASSPECRNVVTSMLSIRNRTDVVMRLPLYEFKKTLYASHV